MTGFTLIEVLVALLILAALAVMSYSGLDTVLNSRAQVVAETDKWQSLATFMTRFKQDVQLAAPYLARSADGHQPAWLGRPEDTVDAALLEFSRFAAVEGQDVPRRVGYGLNANQEIELWLWPALDAAPGTRPERYVVLRNAAALEFYYLSAQLTWLPVWNSALGAEAIPRAVRLRVGLLSGEVIERVFVLGS